MFKNIGKKIHFVAILLAALSFLAFVAFGTLCLIAALEEGVDDLLKSTGIQGAILSYVMALIAPLCCLPLYGFGSLVTAAEKQADDSREMKEMLRHALSEGCLSDEIARKMGAVQLKLQQQAQAQAAPSMMGRPYAPQAPVQRFVSEPAAPAAVTAPAPVASPVAESPVPVDQSPAPAQESPEAVEGSPASAPIAPVVPTFEEEKAAVPQAVQASAPVAQESASPVAQAPAAPAPIAPVAPVAPTARPKPLAPISTAQPIRPIQDSEESF